MANCAGVQPGGKEALECLLRNEPQLSTSCRSAVNAIATPASSPAAPAAAARPAPSDASPPAQGQSSMPAAAAPPSTKSPAAAPTRKTTAGSHATTSPAAASAAASGSAPAATAAPAAAPTVAPPWAADPADATAKGAHDPRAMPSRTAKIVCGSARRRRQNPFLPRCECAAIVADLLRGASARE
jgi:hypothetical protein